MAFNYLGDLYKGEVAYRLQNIGYDIKDVHALNLVMEEMGILKKDGDGWFTTDEGLEYQLGNWRERYAQAWHPTLVDAIAAYLDNQ